MNYKKSKFSNVYWAASSSKWMARVFLNKKQHYLGVFESEEDAHKAVVEFKSSNSIYAEFQKLPSICESFSYADGFLVAKFHTSRYSAGDKVGGIGTSGYVEVGYNGKLLKAHRLIWEVCNGPIPDGMCIDHINGVRHDNRIENLRIVTHAENMKNMRLYNNSKTGILGVVKRNDGRYEAHIGNGKGIEYLGYYSCFFDACCARKSAEQKLGFHENHGRKAA